ncbi:MAG: hypothetical protein IID63_06835 [candidate division Zixibacteria bacterium]|nr:hypothetical protein [candidate division Zixibacteria bacterium]
MDFSNQLLIDTAIIAAGYIFAGAFSVLIYSVATKRHREVQLVNFLPEEGEIKEKKVEGSNPKNQFEFVRFDQSKREPAREPLPEKTDYLKSGRLQRNRLEIIQQAKKMMSSGTAAAEIRKILPLSEAELEFMRRTFMPQARQEN